MSAFIFLLKNGKISWLLQVMAVYGELAAVITALRTGSQMPISVDSLMSTTLVSLAAVESIRRAEPISIADLQQELVARPDEP